MYLVLCTLEEISEASGGGSNPQWFYHLWWKRTQDLKHLLSFPHVSSKVSPRRKGGGNWKSTGFEVRQPGSSSRWTTLLCYMTLELRLITTSGLHLQKAIKWDHILDCIRWSISPSTEQDRLVSVFCVFRLIWKHFAECKWSQGLRFWGN